MPRQLRRASFTAEMNNLSFGRISSRRVGPGRRSYLGESTPVALPQLRTATTVATHISHLRGVSRLPGIGDFVLASTWIGFRSANAASVERRTWPDAPVNKAVATTEWARQGRHFLPGRLNCPCANNDLGDGQPFLRLKGSTIQRRGTSTHQKRRHFITRAVLNGKPISTSPWLGQLASHCNGLLARNGNVNQIAARDGTVLRRVLLRRSLSTLWGKLRVTPRESLTVACGDREKLKAAILQDVLMPRISKPMCTNVRGGSARQQA